MADEPIIEPAPISPENPISEPNPIPASLDEPTEVVSSQTKAFNSAEAPLDKPEAPASPEDPSTVKDQNPANEPLESAPTPENTSVPENPNITIEKHGNDVTITEVMEPTAQPKTETAQMAGNEPLSAVAESLDEAKEKQRRENLNKANLTRQSKKRKKIDDILILFVENSKITNDEVEKLLHVSDATATRYLETLEKEGKIKQVGKTGKGVVYEKI